MVCLDFSLTCSAGKEPAGKTFSEVEPRPKQSQKTIGGESRPGLSVEWCDGGHHRSRWALAKVNQEDDKNIDNIFISGNVFHTSSLSLFFSFFFFLCFLSNDAISSDSLLTVV